MIGLSWLVQGGVIVPIFVIVDTRSDSEARVQFAAAADRFPWPLHYVAEPRRGITFARNAALDTAAAQDCAFVAFIDDDEVPAPRWLAALLAAQQRSGAAAVLGAEIGRAHV